MLGLKFISGVGSWQPNMAEIDPTLLRDAAGAKIGAVLVDDLIGAMKGSGEIIQSGLCEDQIWKFAR
jgi:ornithine cyclodeaminase/alanine dehydrogenase-like protein (mu-crystallin family)